MNGNNENGDREQSWTEKNERENDCVALPSSDVEKKQLTIEKAKTDAEYESTTGGQKVCENDCELQQVETQSDVVTTRNKDECEFRRGGMCVTHGIPGAKLMVTRKLWSKMKNGMHGYKNSKVVKYKCKYVAERRMVTTEVTSSMERGQVGELALGVGDNIPGTDDRISGMGDIRAGADKGKFGED